MAYAEISKLLSQCNIKYSAAEVHGMATGILCCNPQTESSNWLKELLEDGQSVLPQYRDVLVKFFHITLTSLKSDDYTFQLLLPDDSIALTLQAEAFKDWCQGFLYGLGLISNPMLGKSNKCREIMNDFTEFTKLDSEAEGEENEQALIEITEYCRAAVFLLRDELNPRHTGSASKKQGFL